MAKMAHHIGKGRGIRAAELSAQLGIPDRQVRFLVSEAREEGIAICGTPATGYYVASSSEELQETLDFLKERALHSLHLASRLSKITMADLVGQLHLET
jgi:DNA-binding transcriptional regulator LsrR (DeoR family)